MEKINTKEIKKEIEKMFSKKTSLDHMDREINADSTAIEAAVKMALCLADLCCIPYNRKNLILASRFLAEQGGNVEHVFISMREATLKKLFDNEGNGYEPYNKWLEAEEKMNGFAV